MIKWYLLFLLKTFNKQQQRVPGSENIKENRKISKPKESTNDQIMKHESLKFHSIVTPPYFFFCCFVYDWPSEPSLRRNQSFTEWALRYGIHRCHWLSRDVCWVKAMNCWSFVILCHFQYLFSLIDILTSRCRWCRWPSSATDETR